MEFHCRSWALLHLQCFMLDLLPRRRYRLASCRHLGLRIHQLRTIRTLGQLLGGSTRTSTGILRVPILQVLLLELVMS